MLLSEFIERTGITPEREEWQAITEVYLCADVDKDEFCKLWCKMNVQRVKAAKEQKAKEEKEARAIETVKAIYNKLVGKLKMANWYAPAIEVAGEKTMKRLNDNLDICGIVQTDEYCPLGSFVFCLDKKIDEYWDKVAAQKYA